MTGFGERVRELRAASGLTQAELAGRAGISERAVSDIERGLRRGVYAVTASALATALALTTADRASFEAQARAQRSLPPPAPPAAWQGAEWQGLLRTPIVGRDALVAATVAALDSGDVRLLTVTGPGGMGKSRLAAEVCSRLEAEHSRAVRWVSLAAVRDPVLLLPTIAAAVGVAGSGPNLGALVARAFRGRSIVLALDTFEPVLAAAPDVAALLTDVSDLRILVTSRAPLRVRGEHELPLPPLQPEHAAELFAQRATAARPALTVDDDLAASSIRDICARLSYVPLALELAAAKVRHLSLGALSRELERPLHLLIDGDRDLPERQRTMRATIAWSYDFLTPTAQVLLSRLGYFAGGWTLAATQCVGAGKDNETLASPLSVLGQLCEHGLVQMDGSTVVTRWHLQDPVREYAFEALERSGELARVALRHAQFFADLAAASSPLLVAAEQGRTREVLRLELGNLRVALAWSVRTGATDLALQLAGTLWMFWRMEGAFDEGRSWLTAALDMPDAATSKHLPNALWGAAWMAIGEGDYSAAAGFGAELLSLSLGEETAPDRRNALTVLGHVAMAERRYGDSLPPLEEALSIARAHCSPWHIATSLLNLGTAVLHQGEPGQAEAILTEAAQTYAAAGDRHFLARSLIELGYSSLVRVDHAGARARFIEALSMFLELDERWGAAEAVAGFAALAAAGGDAEGAAALTGTSQAVYDDIGAQVLVPDADLAAPLLAGARTALGEVRWTTAVLRGRSLTLEESAQILLARRP